MSYTPLHRELGLDGAALSFVMIDDAVNQKLEETSDLDWKRVLPGKVDHDEFAKDVAAMANSGGGMLVYGVAEKGNGSSAASKVLGVDAWDDGEQRRLQQVAYGSVRPPVQGLDFTLLEDGSRRVVALEVPSSRDVPHLVLRKNEPGFTAPLRYGTMTLYMDERQLEAAYNTRRQRRDADRRHADQLVAEVLERVDLNDAAWIVVSALPVNPRPQHLPRPELPPLTSAISQVMSWNPLLKHHPDEFSPNGRAGLRRWTWTSGYNSQVDYLAELHNDGAVVLAHRVEPVRNEEAADLHPMQLQCGVGRGVWLTRKFSEQLDLDSDFDFRVDVGSRVSPLFIRQYHLRDHLRPREVAVPRFVPVTATGDAHGEIGTLAELTQDLTLDLFNQAGINELGPDYLNTPDEAVTAAEA